jgi:hypothetical protein
LRVWLRSLWDVGWCVQGKSTMWPCFTALSDRLSCCTRVYNEHVDLDLASRASGNCNPSQQTSLLLSKNGYAMLAS